MARKPTETPGRTLRARLMRALLGPLALMLLIGGAASYGLAQYFADTVYDGWLFDSANSLALEVESTPTGPFVDMPAATQRLFEWDVIDKTYFRIRGARKGIIAGRPDMPPVAGDVDPYQGVFFYDLLADLGSIFDSGAEPQGGALIYDGRLDHQDVRVARLGAARAGVRRESDRRGRGNHAQASGARGSNPAQHAFASAPARPSP